MIKIYEIMIKKFIWHSRSSHDDNRFDQLTSLYGLK